MSIDDDVPTRTFSVNPPTEFKLSDMVAMKRRMQMGLVGKTTGVSMAIHPFSWPKFASALERWGVKEEEPESQVGMPVTIPGFNLRGIPIQEDIGVPMGSLRIITSKLAEPDEIIHVRLDEN